MNQTNYYLKYGWPYYTCQRVNTLEGARLLVLKSCKIPNQHSSLLWTDPHAFDPCASRSWDLLLGAGSNAEGAGINSRQNVILPMTELLR